MRLKTLDHTVREITRKFIGTREQIVKDRCMIGVKKYSFPDSHRCWE